MSLKLSPYHPGPRHPARYAHGADSVAAGIVRCPCGGWLAGRRQADARWTAGAAVQAEHVGWPRSGRAG
jgi:hypothetical protein